MSIQFLVRLKWSTTSLLSTKVKVKITWSCLTLCDPMDYTVHGILQARILEWVTFPFSRGSSQSRDRTQVFCTAGDFWPAESQGKPKNTGVGSLSLLQQIFPAQESNQVSGLAGVFFTNWSMQDMVKSCLVY